MAKNFRTTLLRSLPAFVIFASIGFVILSGCTSSKKENDNQEKIPESFHADNDIAMTVKSLVDAIRVGEAIDSLDYDFTGILTDGEGSPLYTNLKGMPGEWTVDVLDKGDVSIKNLDLGDLLPGDLEAYLLTCLRLGPQNKVYLTTEDAIQNSDTDVTVYDFEGGYIRFENRTVTAPNGLEGFLFTIILSSALPQGVETQTAV